MIYDKNNVNNSILSITKSIRNNLSKNRDTLISLVAFANNTNGIISTLVNQIKDLNNTINETANNIKDKNTIENCIYYDSAKLDDYIKKAKESIEYIEIPQDVASYCNEKFSEIIDDEEVQKKQTQQQHSKDLDDWIEEQEQEQEQLTFDKMTEQQRREIVQREKQQEQAIKDLPVGSCGIFDSEDIKGSCMSSYDVTDGSCKIYMGTDSYRCMGSFILDESPVDFSCFHYKTEDGYVQQMTIKDGVTSQLGLNTDTDSPIAKRCTLYGFNEDGDKTCYNGYNDPNGASPTCRVSYTDEDGVENCSSYAAIAINEDGEFIVVSCSAWNNDEKQSCLAFVDNTGTKCNSYISDSSTTSCDNFVAPGTDISCFTYNKNTDNNITQCVEFGQQDTNCGEYTINEENDNTTCNLFSNEDVNSCYKYAAENGSTITIDENGKMTITGGSCQCYGSDGNYSTTNYDKETGGRTDRSEHTDEHGVKTVETTTTDASGESTTTKDREPGYVSSGNTNPDTEEWQDMQKDYWDNHEGELE